MFRIPYREYDVIAELYGNGVSGEGLTTDGTRETYYYNEDFEIGEGIDKAIGTIKWLETRWVNDENGRADIEVIHFEQKWAIPAEELEDVEDIIINHGGNDFGMGLLDDSYYINDPEYIDPEDPFGPNPSDYPNCPDYINYLIYLNCLNDTDGV